MIRMVPSSRQPNLRRNPAKTLVVNDSKPELSAVHSPAAKKGSNRKEIHPHE